MTERGHAAIDQAIKILEFAGVLGGEPDGPGNFTYPCDRCKGRHPHVFVWRGLVRWWHSVPPDGPRMYRPQGA